MMQTSNPVRLPSAAPTGDAMTPTTALQKLRIVIRSAQRHSTWIEKQCGVSGTQLWIMQEIHESPGLRVGEIAHRLAIHQTTVSNVLDSLAKKNLVTKTRDAIDLRVIRLSLSDVGEQLLTRAPKPARGLLPEALQKLSAEQLLLLNAGLLALLESMQNVDDEFALEPLPFAV